MLQILYVSAKIEGRKQIATADCKTTFITIKFANKFKEREKASGKGHLIKEGHEQSLPLLNLDIKSVKQLLFQIS